MPSIDSVLGSGRSDSKTEHNAIFGRGFDSHHHDPRNQRGSYKMICMLCAKLCGLAQITLPTTVRPTRSWVSTKPNML